MLNKLKWFTQVKHLGHTFGCCLYYSASWKGQFIKYIKSTITHFGVDIASWKGQFIKYIKSTITHFRVVRPVCKFQILVTHTHGYSFLWIHTMVLTVNNCLKHEILLCTDYMICLELLILGFLSHIRNMSHGKQNIDLSSLYIVYTIVNSGNDRVI